MSAGDDRLVVPVAKGTLVRFFVTLLFGIVGCVFALWVSRENPSPVDSVFRALTATGLVFCVLTALFVARRLFDPTPGLVLDSEGIVDHSNMVGAGRIRWDEIQEIRITKSVRQRFLTVVVDDPRKFIERGGPLRRRLAEANHRKAGSPINITARTLRIPFEDLVARASEFYRRYGRPR